MTSAALPCSVEIRFTFFSITGNDVAKSVGAAMARRVGADVEPSDDIGDLRFGERKFGHAFVGAALADDGGDEDAFFVIENENGADEIRRAGTSFAGCAVATRAEGREDFAAAFERCGVLAGTGDGCGTDATVVCF